MKKLILKNFILISVCCLGSLILAIMGSMITVYLKNYLDSDISSSEVGLATLVAIILIQRFMMPLMNGINSYLYTRLSVNIESEILSKAYQYISSRSSFQAKEKATGEINSAISRAVESCKNLFAISFRSIATSLITVFVNAILIGYYFGITICLASNALSFLFLYMAVRLMKRKRSLIQELRKADDELAKFVTDDLIIKNQIHQAKSIRELKFRRIQAELKRVGIKNCHFMLQNNFFLGLGIVLVFTINTSLILANEPTIGSLIFLNFTLGAILFEASSISANWRSIIQATEDYQIIENFCLTISDAKKTEVLSLTEKEWELVIKLNHHTVELSNDRKITFDLSLKFKNTLIGIIVGENGIGKSTLISIIEHENRCLEPVDSYHALVQDAKGKVIYSSRDDSRLLDLAVVYQNDEFFNESVYENILLSNRNVDDQVALNLLNKMGFNFTSIDDTKTKIVGEAGSNLSGGERKKLSIVRALLLNPKTIILDEPFVHIDSSSTTSIMELMASLVPKVMFIVITHDLEIVNRYPELTEIQGLYLNNMTVKKTG